MDVNQLTRRLSHYQNKIYYREDSLELISWV